MVRELEIIVARRKSYGTSLRTTLEDITELCKYLATKPTGATVKEAKTVLNSKRLDGRKLAALKFWDLISEEEDGRLKLSPAGRKLVEREDHVTQVLLNVVHKIPAYSAIVERVAHRHEDSLTTLDVAAHWHDHFREEVGENESSIKNQAICFFHVTAGAKLGTLIPGRKGNPTRFSFAAEALIDFIGHKGQAHKSVEPLIEGPDVDEEEEVSETPVELARVQETRDKPLGQSIFIAHGKNKKPLEQLKKILEQFKIPHKVAMEEPNLGRPISGKVREVMKSCNCAILIFTADEKLTDKDGKTIFRPSENVVYELGASGYLYDHRIVIMKETDVDFPANFGDLGYISFEKDDLESRTMDILNELIGFGIVKIST